LRLYLADAAEVLFFALGRFAYGHVSIVAQPGSAGLPGKAVTVTLEGA
jgi:hypothetical protein